MRKIGLTIILIILVFGFVNANSINSFQINSGDTYTNSQSVTLNIDATDASEMKFSCDGITFSNYESYSETKTWNLNSGNYGCGGGTGSRTVYIKVKYSDLNESSGAHNDSIIVDTQGPIVDSFSPLDEVVGGDGKDGQQITIDLSDNGALETIAIGLERNGLELYSETLGKCSITGATDTCTFTDLKVDRGAEYTYNLTITDEAGNSTSGEYSFSFTDSIGPAAPTGLVAQDHNVNIELNWNENTENDFYRYSIHRSKTTLFDANSSNRIGYSEEASYFDTGLEENTEYFYKIRAIDLTGNPGPESTEVSETSGYALPGEFEIEADNCRNDSWCDATRDITFTFEVTNAKYNYALEENDNALASKTYSECVEGSTKTYSDLNEGIYYFKVIACKPSGNSEQETFVLKLDNTKPTIVGSLDASLEDRLVVLEWTAANDNQGTENSGLSHYNIYRSKTSSLYALIKNKIAETGYLNTTYVDRTTEPETTYYYKVIAVDNAGNFSSNTESPQAEILTPYRPESEVARATITITNEDGEVVEYYNKEQKLNLSVQFSKEVRQIYVYKTVDGGSKETLKGGIVGDVVETSFNVDQNTEEVKIEVRAEDDAKQIVKEKYVYLDNTLPQASWNIEEGETLSKTKKIEIDANDDTEISRIEVYYRGAFLGNANDVGGVYTFNFDTTQFEQNGLLAIVIYDLAENPLKIETEIKIDFEANQSTKNNIEELKTLKKNAEELFVNFGIFEVDIPQKMLDAKSEADTSYQDADALMQVNVVSANEKAILAKEKYNEILTDTTFQVIKQRNFDYNREIIDSLLEGIGLNENQILETTQLIKRNGAKRHIEVLKYNVEGVDYFVSKIVITLENVDNTFPELKVVEAIPKQIIQNATEIKSSEPYEIIKEDPTIAFIFPTGKGGRKTFAYTNGVRMTETQAMDTRNWMSIYQTPPLVFLPETEVENIGYVTDATPLINALIIITVILIVGGIIFYFKAKQMQRRPKKKPTHEELAKEGKTTMSVLETKTPKQKTLMEEMQENPLAEGSAKGTLKLTKKEKKKAKMEKIMSHNGSKASSIMSKGERKGPIEKIKGLFKKEKEPAYKKKY